MSGFLYMSIQSVLKLKHGSLCDISTQNLASVKGWSGWLPDFAGLACLFLEKSEKSWVRTGHRRWAPDILDQPRHRSTCNLPRCSRWYLILVAIPPENIFAKGVAIDSANVFVPCQLNAVLWSYGSWGLKLNYGKSLGKSSTMILKWNCRWTRVSENQ